MTAALVIRGTAGRAGAAAMRGTTVSDEFTQCWYAPNPTCKEVEWSREWCRFCLLTDRDEKLVEVAHWSGRAHRAEARIRELEDGIRHQGHSERCGWNMMNPCTCLMSLLPEEDDRE